MKRTIILIATLIAVFISSLQGVHASSNTSVPANVFMADYHNGAYYAAIINTDNTVTAVKIVAEYEDIMPAYGNMVTATLDFDDNGAIGTLHMFSAEYNQEFVLDYRPIDQFDVESAHIVGYVDNTHNVTTGTLDGDIVQFDGNIVNGSVIKLRSADVLATTYASGYLVQNGNLVRYVATDKEERVYTTRMALVAR